MVLKVLVCLLLMAGGLGAQDLQIAFIDVGQGDAVLISSPEGRRALIDAGPSRAGVDAQLRARGIDTLDLVIASHNHADHIGGMEAVLRSRRVRYYLDNGVPHTTATYQRVIAAVAASGAQYLRATARTITLGSVRLRVLPPPGIGGEQNDNSVGILLEYGTFRALFTGDSETGELAYWLARDSVPRVSLVKAAHHGSWNGTSASWAERTRPSVVVVSVAARNAYGHPSPSALAQWQAVGARIYRTDVHGPITVTVRSDGVFSVGRQVMRSTEGGAEPVNAPVVRPEVPRTDSVSPNCCRTCTVGQACGNSCISRRYQCRRPPGCACNATP
jgi:beta-lactamase superfamily II metal-dependent hydrolase